MKYFRNWIAITTFAFALLTAFSTFSYADAFFAPVLPPTIEVAYQAVLADEHVLIIGDATLNDQLRSIDIRTALEDTGRLRYDKG